VLAEIFTEENLEVVSARMPAPSPDGEIVAVMFFVAYVVDENEWPLMIKSIHAVSFFETSTSYHIVSTTLPFINDPLNQS
jgi:hypothetical protein